MRACLGRYQAGAGTQAIELFWIPARAGMAIKQSLFIRAWLPIP